MRALVVAGTHSGVGKTSLAVGLMLALRARGLVVQSFKVGPDFLDPLWHQAATSRPAINLDSYMMSQQQVLQSFCRHASTADISIVEGVMGLFDSRDGSSEEGSTAQIAKWMGAPVLLAVDCWSMARSVAALVKGYAEFDPQLQLPGVLLNKVGSAAHGAWLQEALAAAWQQQKLAQPVEVLGCIPKDEGIAVPERYLGLTMPHEQQQQQSWQSRLCEVITQHIDLDRVIELAGTACLPGAAAGPPRAVVPAACRAQEGNKAQKGSTSSTNNTSSISSTINTYLPNSTGTTSTTKELTERQALEELSAASSGGSSSSSSRNPITRCCRIAVARDEAFCFYYHDNIFLLEAAGAEVVFFSPLHDAQLPANIQGIYLGGGYPERFAQQLSGNVMLLQQLRQFATDGGVVYAECGGLLYLCKGFWQQCSSSCSCRESTDERSGSSRSKDGGSREDGGSSSTKKVEAMAQQSNQQLVELVPLAGVLPFTTRMGKMQMGYVEVTVLPENPLFPPGCIVRGQVYHFSEIAEADATSAASSGSGSSSSSIDSTTNSSSCSSSDGDSSGVRHTYELLPVLPGAVPVPEGFSVGNVLASYVHLHFGGCPELAAALVSKCCSRSESMEPSSSCTSSSSQAAAAAAAACVTTTSCSSSSSISCTSKLLQEAAETTQTSCSSGSNLSGCWDSVTAGHTSNEKTCTTNSTTTNSTTTNSSSSSSSPPGTLTIKNDKIVSLLPSGTEIVCALGLADRLVGVSAFCDFPPAEVRGKPVAVKSLIDVDDLTSDEVEAAMQSFKAARQSPFSVDVELLRRERPGLLLTQDACGTCDADKSLVSAAMQAAGLSPASTTVLVLHPQTLADVMHSILDIGKAAAAEERAQQLVRQLQQRLAAVAAAVVAACPAAAELVSSCTANGGQHQQQGTGGGGGGGDFNNVAAAATAPEGSCCPVPPRVLSLEGLNPLVLGGQWLPDIKRAAGCADAAGQEPGAAPVRISWQQVLDYAPEVLLLCPCSRSPAAAMPDVERLMQQPGFHKLPAVQAGRMFVVDHAAFSRPGPRLVEAVELLARLVHGITPESLVSTAAAALVATSDGTGEAARLAPSASATVAGAAASVTANPDFHGSYSTCTHKSEGRETAEVTVLQMEGFTAGCSTTGTGSCQQAGLSAPSCRWVKHW